MVFGGGSAPWGGSHGTYACLAIEERYWRMKTACISGVLAFAIPPVELERKSCATALHLFEQGSERMKRSQRVQSSAVLKVRLCLGKMAQPATISAAMVVWQVNLPGQLELPSAFDSPMHKTPKSLKACLLILVARRV